MATLRRRRFQINGSSSHKRYRFIIGRKNYRKIGGQKQINVTNIKTPVLCFTKITPYQYIGERRKFEKKAVFLFCLVRFNIFYPKILEWLDLKSKTSCNINNYSSKMIKKTPVIECFQRINTYLSAIINNKS